MSSRLPLRRGSLFALSVTVVLAGLALSQRAARDAGPAAQSAHPSALPFDPSRVVEQARTAFRETPGGFEASTGAQLVEVQGGRVQVTPRDERAGVRFETRSIRRGGRELWSRHGVTGRVGPGELVTAAAEVEEQLRSTAEGLEQSWAFDAAPGGEGDLVVAVAVDTPCTAQTASGLHFGAGSASVRYGHATWVDGRGLRTPVEATWRDGEVLLSVPAALLAASTFPAVLDPLISAELAVDQPTYAASRAAETTPAIAWNGTHYLVVFAAGAQIVAVRVDATGAPVDPAGTTVAPDSSRIRSEPDVASDGVDWYVVWSDLIGGTPTVHGSVVTAAGASTAPATRIRLDTQNSRWDTDLQPRIAFGNGSYLVAWTLDDQESGNEFKALGLVSLSPAGVKTSEYEYYDMSAWRESPDVAFDGTSFLVTWLDMQAGNSNVWARAFSATSGQPAGAAFAVTSSNDVISRPALAWNGNRYLVAWRTTRSAPLVGALVTASPATVTPNTSAGLSITSGAVAPEDPAVTAFGTSGSGSTFLVSWREGAALRGTRVTNAGAVTDSPSLLLASGTGTRALPTVGATSAGAVLAWEDSRSGALDIWARSVSTSGAPGAEALLSKLPPTQLAPAVAFGASTYLVVWQDWRNDVLGDIYAARVDRQGVVLDSSAIPVSTAAGRQGSPDVTFIAAGNQFLVTWTDGRDGGTNIVGARVTPAGAVLDSAGLVICDAPSSQDHPAVASNGASALVTWGDLRNGPAADDIYGTLVFPDAGVSPGPSVGIQVNAGFSMQKSPDVTWNGLHYLVAWEDHRAVAGFPDIYAARVTGAGTVLDSQGLVVSARRLPDGGPMKEDLVSVAAVGDTVLVSWSLDQSSQRDVQGRLLKTSPGLDGGPAFAIASGDAYQSNPAVASDGTTFFVSWVVSISDDGGADYGVWGTRVDARNGGILDAPALALSPSTGGAAQGSPAVASAGARAFLAAYDRFDVSPAFNATRVRARRVSNTPPTATGASLTTNEDTDAGVTLAGTDGDGDTITCAVATPPTNGVLTGTPPTLTYWPTANYAGADALTFTCSDGLDTSSAATISITVTPVNDLPTANSQSVSTTEDTPVAFTLTGSDVESATLGFETTLSFTNGQLSCDGGACNYQPNSNFNGVDTLRFRTRDANNATSNEAQVTVTVAPVNDAPVATPQSPTTNEDTPLTITLAGTDVENSPLTYPVVTTPSKGVLSGTPPNLVYTPNLNANGGDSFSFTVRDGTVDSLPAQVLITIIAVNDAPVAIDSAVGTARDIARNVTLEVTDVDTTVLTYTVVTQPASGTLTGSGGTRLYSPNAGFAGPDTFTFKANDGSLDSNVATVTVTVGATNREPVATGQSVSTPEDTGTDITLMGSDPDSNPLSFVVVTQPTHGTLSGSGATLRYQPAAEYSGADSFTFKAHDGMLDSLTTATVSITITAVNDPPVAASQTVTTNEDTEVPIVLRASDPDMTDSFMWELGSVSHGMLGGTAPNLTYRPSANFSGSDQLVFKARDDGGLESATATVDITISPVNDPPTAVPIDTSTAEGEAVVVTLAGADIEGDPLSFSVATQPAQGSLSGDAPELTYLPAPGFAGTDTFTYTSSDGAATSAPATVTITVTPGNVTPREVDTTRLNGWSCGCSTGAADAGLGALALLGLTALRRRRAGVTLALAAVLVAAAPAAALARPAAKKTATKKAPAPTPEPAPAPVPAEPVAAPPPVEAAAPAPRGPPSLAALDVLITATGEELDGVAFTEMVTTAVDQAKLYRVISSRDIATILGVERQKALLGCTDDTTCLTEIADALGSDFVMQGTVGKVGDTYLVTVRLIDSKKSRVVGRGAGQTGDKNLLLNLVWKSTQEALDNWGASLPPEEARKVASRPQVAPLTAVAPPRSKLGVVVAVVGGYQPLAPAGSRGTIGGEVGVSWRLGRLDLGAGVVISPTPGARIFGMVALLQGQHRVSVGLRASGFFGPAVYGGGPAVEYELGLGETFGIRALAASEVYGSSQGLVLAILGGLGASARF